MKCDQSILKFLLVEVVPLERAGMPLIFPRGGAATCVSARMSKRLQMKSGLEFAGVYRQRQPRPCNPPIQNSYHGIQFHQSHLVVVGAAGFAFIILRHI